MNKLTYITNFSVFGGNELQICIDRGITVIPTLWGSTGLRLRLKY